MDGSISLEVTHPALNEIAAIGVKEPGASVHQAIRTAARHDAVRQKCDCLI